MNERKRSKREQTIRVYLSHSAADMVVARKLRNLLLTYANARVFLADDLSAGEDWETRMRAELADADVVVALLTPNAVNSNWVLHEIGAAWALKKSIIPVVTRRDVLNALPLSLQTAKVLELDDVDSPKVGGELVEAVESTLASIHSA